VANGKKNLKSILIAKRRFMKQCIAIPTVNGQLCAHFGHCDQFAIVETSNGEIINEKWITPPPHEPGLLPRWLADQGITDVIAGGMGQRAIALFNQNMINVFVGAPTKQAKELVYEFLQKRLTLTANYCNHVENHDHHQCRH